MKTDLITEIHNAEKTIEQYARYYHAKEKDCPNDFKFLMLINNWHSPFIALNELLKRIYTNELLLRREQKITGIKNNYKSRYRELEELVQEYENKNLSYL